MNKDIQEKDSSVFSMINFLICFTVTIIFYNYMYNVTQDGRSVFLNALAETNVEIYVAGLIVFSVSYIILEFIIGNSKTVKQLNVIINSSTIKLNRICGWVISLILCAAGVGLYVHWNYITQWDEAGVANGTFYDFPVLFRALLILIGGGYHYKYCQVRKGYI